MIVKSKIMGRSKAIDPEAMDRAIKMQEDRDLIKANNAKVKALKSRGKTGKHTLPRAKDQPYPDPDAVAKKINSLLPPHLARLVR